MVGVGYEAPLADEKSWMYFPDPEVPFYRATKFAKYSPAHVPGADTKRYCAYMTETAFSEHKPVDRDTLGYEVERGLRRAGVITGRPSVASLHVETIDYVYPVPTLGRDRALQTIQPWLLDHEIYSCGRFGACRYESGNMDHAVKMGIDVARDLVASQPPRPAIIQDLTETPHDRIKRVGGNDVGPRAAPLVRLCGWCSMRRPDPP
jgi:hypothetical protein